MITGIIRWAVLDMLRGMEKRKVSPVVEGIGWYGPFALILGYALVSFDIIEAKGYVFQLLNLSGSLAIIVISLSKKVYQSVVLNIFWIIIAVIVLAQLLFA
jgi:hypothetical protein